MGKTKGKVKEMKKLKTIKENWDNTTQSADKKPEKYIKPDGKVGIRMVPVKKEGAIKKKPMDENTEIVEAQDPEMEKVKQLVRIGLMNKKDMTKIVRALTLMKEGKPVPQKERKILFDMLGELIGMITGDDAMFNKARKAVKEEKDMNDMCCKHCGDEFGKPKSESCMYDAYDMAGRNWCSKKEYLSSQNMKNEALDTSTAKRVAEESEQLDELTAAEKKLINQMYDRKGNLTPLGKKVMNHGKKPGDRGYVESVDEALERDGPKKPDIFKKGGSFGKAASTTPAVQKYMAKRAAGNQARNKAMDPGAAKKGYGIGVTDVDKADKKAKAKGTSIMKRMASKGKNYKAGKMI